MASRYRRCTSLLSMELLLCGTIKDIGEKYEIVNVPQEVALKLLGERAAYVATPLIRKRFAEQIRKSAERRLTYSQ